MKAIIFCSAEIKSYDYLRKFDFKQYMIICADGGYVHAQRLGIIPDIIFSDKDSFKGDFPHSIKAVICSPEKDDTDTGLGVKYAIEHGAREIILIGGIGGRLDQEYTHFCLMKYALDRGVRLKLIDDINEIWMEDSGFELKNNSDKTYVSFFAYGGEVTDFCIKGLKYETENMLLSPGLVQASSNEFAKEDTAQISFDSGTVLIMLCSDPK